jgi:hypothetical protein
MFSPPTCLPSFAFHSLCEIRHLTSPASNNRTGWEEYLYHIQVTITATVHGLELRVQKRVILNPYEQKLKQSRNYYCGLALGLQF